MPVAKHGRLVIARYAGQSCVIDENIEVLVKEVRVVDENNNVSVLEDSDRRKYQIALSIKAPKNISVKRGRLRRRPRHKR